MINLRCLANAGHQRPHRLLPQSADPHFGLGLAGFAARVREGEPGAAN